MSKNRAKEALLAWFRENKRDFPWRVAKTPYDVWVSEVMLQQTRASVVVPYFIRFKQQFPTVEALAAAPIERVVKAWEGLGYYKRARSLHQGAQFVVGSWRGVIPAAVEELKKIPGVGAYTAGAIASFAFGQRAAAIDGNVQRVLARLLCLEELISTAASQRKVLQGVEDFLAGENSAETMEALIEFGALVCGKTPVCCVCPLKQMCLAKDKGCQQELPLKGKKLPTLFIKRNVLLLRCAGKFLVYQEKRGALMQDLWQLPYCDEAGDFEPACLRVQGAQFVQALREEKQSFTRYQVTLYPKLWELAKRVEIENYAWKSLEELDMLPFCSGHRRVIRQLLFL